MSCIPIRFCAPHVFNLINDLQSIFSKFYILKIQSQFFLIFEHLWLFEIYYDIAFENLPEIITKVNYLKGLVMWDWGYEFDQGYITQEE